MTDLKCKCPSCGEKLSRYIHSVDSCGIGADVPLGNYKFTCAPSGYLNTDKKPDKYCGLVFEINWDGVHAKPFGYEKAYTCYECNCNMTLEEFTSESHAEEHEGKWLNGDPMMKTEILNMRKGDPLSYNTLENIKKEPFRKDGNKVRV